MTREEFTNGINILVSCFPKSTTEEKVSVLYDNYFAGLNFDPDVWIRACKMLGETKERFPALAMMKSAYWEVAKEKKRPDNISHVECQFCSNGLRTYYKYKGHREDGSKVKYTYCALCDCELGSQYSPKLKDGKYWATWSEKEKQGKFIQREGEILPEFIPFTDKYSEEQIPF